MAYVSKLLNLLKVLKNRQFKITEKKYCDRIITLNSALKKGELCS